MAELDKLQAYWSAFPGLKEALFTPRTDEKHGDLPYMDLAVEDVKQAIKTHPDVEAFVKAFTEALAHYPSFLKEEPLEKMD